LLVGGPTLIGSRLLLAAGALKRTDGWRRAAGQMLRGEESVFVLSAFGLVPPSAGSHDAGQSHVAAHLRDFLGNEPLCRVRVRRLPEVDLPEPCDAPSYTLAFARWLEGPERFVPPGSWHAEGTPDSFATSGSGTAPLMNIVCRVSAAGECDVWARINHAATDGVPMQEILTRLETAWKPRAAVLFPVPEAFAPFAKLRPTPGRAGIVETTWFTDFAPVLAWRKRVNAGRTARKAEPMTISAAILWKLAQVPEFRSLHLGTTVESGEVGGIPRGVGVNVTRPADFGHDARGLSRYIDDFNRQLELNRRRASDGCRTLDAAAKLPPRMAAALLRHALRRNPRTFGTMALTMLKDARVFCVPIGEVGHDDGFIAIGSLSLPTTDGRQVGCISLKGPAERISRHHELITNALTGADQA
jgi:hypothetical protein